MELHLHGYMNPCTKTIIKLNYFQNLLFSVQAQAEAHRELTFEKLQPKGRGK